MLSSYSASMDFRRLSHIQFTSVPVLLLYRSVHTVAVSLCVQRLWDIHQAVFCSIHPLVLAHIIISPPLLQWSVYLAGKRGMIQLSQFWAELSTNLLFVCRSFGELCINHHLLKRINFSNQSWKIHYSLKFSKKMVLHRKKWVTLNNSIWELWIPDFYCWYWPIYIWDKITLHLQSNSLRITKDGTLIIPPMKKYAEAI